MRPIARCKRCKEKREYFGETLEYGSVCKECFYKQIEEDIKKER